MAMGLCVNLGCEVLRGQSPGEACMQGLGRGLLLTPSGMRPPHAICVLSLMNRTLPQPSPFIPEVGSVHPSGVHAT